MKRFYIKTAAMLLMIIAAFTFCVSAAAEESEEVFGTYGKNILWSIDFKTETITISGEGEMKDALRDDTPWSGYLTDGKVKRVVIEEGVTYISADSFPFRCIEEIEIPSSVERIGSGAFRFAGITEVVLPENLKEIGNTAFGECSKLEKINFPEGLEIMGDNAFLSTRVREVVLPSSLKKMGIFAFGYCSSLKSVSFGTGIDKISKNAFYECTSLRSVVLPSELTDIEDAAFANCTALEDVTLGENTKSIGNRAFENCAELKYIELPETVEALGMRAFSGCKKLELKQNAPLGSVTYSLFKDCENLKSVIISEECEEIDREAFMNCTSLESVNLPEGLKKIGESAFRNCSSLKKADIPSGLTETGDYAFFGCSSIEELIFPDGEKIKLSVTLCSSLKNVRIPGGTKFINLSGCKELESVSLPEGCESVTFADCESLKSVELPDSVTYLNGGSFKNCKSLKEVIIPGSVKTVNGTELFSGCTSLERVVLPESVTSTDKNMFSGCTALIEVIFNSGVVDSLAEGSFKDCTSLYNLPVTYETTISSSDVFSNTGWFNTQPDGVVYYKKMAMGYKGEMPQNYELMFSNDCIAIASGAFQNRSEITKITIPESVIYIYNSAFSGCTNLSEIIVPDTALRLGSNVFDSTAWYNSKGSGTIYLGKVLYKYNGKKRDEFTASIKAGTKAIAGSAFANMSGFIFEADVPVSVEYIAPGAFYEYDALIVDVTIRNRSCVINGKTAIRGYFEDWTFITSYGSGSVYDYASQNRYTYIALACKHNTYTVLERTKAGCDTEGRETRRCANCGIYSEVKLKPTGHSFKAEENIEASCTQPGYIKNICENCGEVHTQIIAAKGHKSAEKVIKPTCTQQGCKVKICAVCGEEERYDYLPALGHDEAVCLGTEPSCIEEGSEQGIFCKRCGEMIKEGNAIARSGHSFGEWYVSREATCRISEQEERKCTVCGLKETAESNIYREHSFGEWYVSREATCEISEQDERKCTVCGLKETVESDVYGEHSFGSWVMLESGSCTDDKVLQRTCSVCQHLEAKVQPGLKTHTFKKSLTKATMSKSGKITETCTVCGKKVTTRIAKISSVKLSKTSYVYDGKSKKPVVTVKDSEGNLLRKDRDYTVEYLANKNCGNAKVKVTFTGSYSGSKTITFEITPPAPTVKSTEAATGSVKIKYGKVKQADGYEIYCSSSKKGEYKSAGRTANTSFTVKNLKPGKTYYFKVRSYKTVDGKKVYSPFCEIVKVKVK